MQSHLVRAPLARILGLLPMLSNEADESEKLQIITYLNYSANELDLIIRDITEKSTSVIQKYPEAGPQSDLSAS